MGERRTFGPDWTKDRPGHAGKGADWRHVPSGWVTRHCGHPTALWPYYVEHPGQPGSIVVSFNGLGWKTAAAARAAIGVLAAGRATLAPHHAKAGALCLQDLQADGTPAPEAPHG